MKTNRNKKLYSSGILDFPLLPLLVALVASSNLVACSSIDRIKNIGEVPPQSAVQNPDPNCLQPVTCAHARGENLSKSRKFSLDRSPAGVFQRRRHQQVGDIMTVVINIDDKGKMQNATDRTRSLQRECRYAKIPRHRNQIGAGSARSDRSHEPKRPERGDSSFKGDGTTDRKEKIEMKLAATVTQVLPNGNMVIQGSQEVRVNYENRLLKLAGVVRPQDVNVDNTVSYEKIAEARIAYGGNGQFAVLDNQDTVNSFMMCSSRSDCFLLPAYPLTTHPNLIAGESRRFFGKKEAVANQLHGHNDSEFRCKLGQSALFQTPNPFKKPVWPLAIEHPNQNRRRLRIFKKFGIKVKPHQLNLFLVDDPQEAIANTPKTMAPLRSFVNRNRKRDFAHIKRKEHKIYPNIFIVAISGSGPVVSHMLNRAISIFKLL